MKTTLHLIFGLIVYGSALAQNYTLNWGTSFSPAWANGATSCNAFNIGGSGINCTVNVVKSGGSFASSYGISAPTVSYSQVTVPGSNNNLLLALDYTNPSQYTDITFTFSTIVYDLYFNLSDLDRLTSTSNSYFDKVTITGSIGMTSVLPTITKYDATTDPNFLVISGNVARVNAASGMAGNTASDATDQKGTIKVNFGGKAVTSFKIRYNNYSGVASDPGLQYIGIGNISFYQSWPLAVQLTSFEAENNNGKNSLKWGTVNESEMAYYAIEKSSNGKDFSEIGRTTSRNSTAAEEYIFTDYNTTGNNTYRLKMVNKDGSYVYSQTVLLRTNDVAEIRVFPSIFTSSLRVVIPSSKQETIQATVTDLSGKIVFRQTYKLQAGTNEFPMEFSASLARGQYFILFSNSGKAIGVIRQ